MAVKNDSKKVRTGNPPLNIAKKDIPIVNQTFKVKQIETPKTKSILLTPTKRAGGKLAKSQSILFTSDSK